MRTFVYSIAILCLLLSGAAHAFDDPDTEAARRHFTAGAALYEDGKYDSAIVEFAAARTLRPSPALDYNIARCHDRLEHSAEAADGYQRFLDRAPPGAQTDEVKARLTVLRARLATRVDRVPVVQTGALVTHAPRHPYSIAVPAAFTGVALGALVVGGALYGVSGGKYDDLKGEGCGTTTACFDSRWGGTRSIERAGIGLLVSGGVLGAASIALWAGWRSR